MSIPSFVYAFPLRDPEHPVHSALQLQKLGATSFAIAHAPPEMNSHPDLNQRGVMIG